MRLGDVPLAVVVRNRVRIWDCLTELLPSGFESPTCEILMIHNFCSKALITAVRKAPPLRLTTGDEPRLTTRLRFAWHITYARTVSPRQTPVYVPNLRAR
jgi:hypothetical protein